MTPEQILELAKQCDFDTRAGFDGPIITFATAIAQRTRDECAASIPTTRSEIQLICGELNAREWRAVSSMLSLVQRQIRSMK